MTFRMAAFSCCLTIQLGGCGGAHKPSAYEAAVKKYSAALAERWITQYACIELEFKKNLVLDDAALACLVDRHGHSKAETTACKCAGGEPDKWQTNCADWLAVH